MHAGTELQTLDYTNSDDVTSDDVMRAGSKIELLIRCENLPDLDTFSKSDPMCVLFTKQLGQWMELDRTEAVDNMANPAFVDTFILDYNHYEDAKLKFAVYNTDSRSTDLARHDLIGSVETTLRSLVRLAEKITENFFTLRAPGDSRSRGEILIVSEFVRPTRSKLHLHVGANLLTQNLVNKMLKTRNSVLEIRKSMSPRLYHPIYRSQAVEKTSEPRWRPFTLSIQKLCNGDCNRQVELAVYRIERAPNGNGSVYKLVGATRTTLSHITNDPRKTDLPIIKYREGAKAKVKSKGFIRLLRKTLDMAYSLLDYIRGGCRLNLVIAIDFTLSNGVLNNGSSLHQLSEIENEYIVAIKSIGSLLSKYDVQQNIAAFGFGAKKNARCKRTRHCFPLEGADPYCVGIKGVLECYRRTVQKVAFSGPSKMAAVIQEAARLSTATPVTQDNQHYTICLIITDGVLNDLDETTEALTESLSCPLSVLAVGVGPADFSPMEQFTNSLEAKAEAQSNGHKVRSNLHFTSLRTERRGAGLNTVKIRESIGQVSSQMIEHLSDNLIKPNAPIPTHHQHQNNHRLSTTIGNWTDGLETIPSDDTTSLTFSLTVPAQNGTMRVKAQPTLGPTCPTCGCDIEATCDPIFTLDPTLS